MGYIEWFKMRPLSIVTEIGYVGKSVKENIAMTTTIYDSLGYRFIDANFPGKAKRVDYFILSSLVKLTFHGKYISPYLLIGPRFDIYLHVPFTSIPDYVKYRPVNFSGTIGIGTEFDFSENFSKKVPVLFLE